MLLRCRQSRLKFFKILLVILALIVTLTYFKLLSYNVRQDPRVPYTNSDVQLSKDEQVWEDKITEYEKRLVPGLGNNGEPSYLQGEEQSEGEKALKSVALNTVLSDRMPLDRRLKDPRNKKLVT